MSPTYTLVTVPNATLESSSLSPNGTWTWTTLTGQLTLESVTFDTPPTATAIGAAVTQDVLLVLVLRTDTGNNNIVAFEAPLDPARTVTVSSVPPSRRRYVFHAPRDDDEFTVELPIGMDDNDNDELFHSVLEGYLTDLRVHSEVQSQSARAVEETVVARPEEEDLRGQFMPMDDGEIVKMLDRSGRMHHEDRSLVENLEDRERRDLVPVAVAVELWNAPNNSSSSPENTSTTSEAHILVTLPNATLTSSSLSPGGSGIGTTLIGQLTLEYVTFDIPPIATAVVPQGVLLVLVLRTGTGNNVACEEPLDPSRTLTVSSVLPSGARRYVFHATRDDAEFTVELPVVTDDVELFHSVLEGYMADLRIHGELQQSQSARVFVEESAAGSEGEDLRGRFVLMNEDDGEIVGTLDNSVRVHEDQSLAEKGRERDPVVVELPEGADTVDGLRDEEVLVRTIPPENRDWMLKGAVFVCNAISGTTTLLTRAMTTASNLYIAHSTPNTPSSSSSSSGRGAPPVLPRSRSPLLLESPTTPNRIQSQPPTTPLRTNTRTRLSLSAALILASLEASAVQLVEAGGAAVSAALSHKYGTTTAEENLAIVGRKALNIVLVYVDARGLGRKVVVKQMAKSWIRGRIAAARRR